MAPKDITPLVRRLTDAGVAVTVLPPTDLFLTGRDADRLIPRGLAPAALMAEHGVVVSLASNNILNPFTPFGDGLSSVSPISLPTSRILAATGISLRFSTW